MATDYANLFNSTDFANLLDSLENTSLGEDFLTSMDDDSPPWEPNSDNFDLNAIIHKFVGNAKKARRTRSQLTLDMRHCVMVGLLNGNIRSDQLNRIVKWGSDRIRELIRIYDIPTRRNSTDRSKYSKDSFTFTRSFTCFPGIASKILNRRPSLVKDYHGSTMRTPELPACMKHSGFAALIPRNCNDLVKAALQSAHIAYMIDFGRFINRGGFQSVMKSHDKQKKISEITMEEGRMADDGRAAYLHSLGLFDTATFKTVVTVANELMREVNADKISEDAIDAALLSVVETMSPSDGGGFMTENEVFPGATSGETGSSSKEVFHGATSGEASSSPLNQSGDLVPLCSSLGSSSSPGGADVCDTTEKDAIPSASSGATSLHRDATEMEVFPSTLSGAPSQSHLP
ncbi:hypothetical protein AAHA92_02024 [Salvia divinorum]|uniref:Uncharacterized protein n=1 Tax=Salvia divinorum TaxID=28513 RepID=A0ABD1IF21_SALDI